MPLPGLHVSCILIHELFTLTHIASCDRYEVPHDQSIKSCVKNVCVAVIINLMYIFI